MTESAPTTKAGASEPSLTERLKMIFKMKGKPEPSLSQIVRAMGESVGINWGVGTALSIMDAIEEHERSDAATRAALKDAIKELKIAIASIGRWNGSTVEQVEHASVPLVKEVISKLSALAGEQEG